MQNEFNPLFLASEVWALCKKEGIVCQAYASMQTGSLGLKDNKVVKMVASNVEHGCALLPRMKTNRDICGFKSCKEDKELKMMEEIQVVEAAKDAKRLVWTRDEGRSRCCTNL